MVSTVLLSSNETVGLGAIEITSIPDISILTPQPETAAEQVMADYKRDMANLLTEIYQQYKALNASVGANSDLSIECLWTTQAVKNQPYKAEIKLYLIARAIDVDKNALENTLDAALQKYNVFKAIYKTYIRLTQKCKGSYEIDYP